jgi:subtilisin-like proprotein convertase family protein
VVVVEGVGGRASVQRVTPAQARTLERSAAVEDVRSYVAPELHDERASLVLLGRTSNGGRALRLPGFRGALGTLAGTAAPRVLVDVTDDGIDDGTTEPRHPDFRAGSTDGASRLAYQHDFLDSPNTNPDGCGGHGTLNASIIAGDPGAGGAVDAGGYQHGLGVLPGARLGSTQIFACDGTYANRTPYAQLVRDAYRAGARITNNSWGINSGAAYDTNAQQYDALVRDADPDAPGDQPMTVIFSVGNRGPGAGTVSSPATAKNVIAVGATEGIRPSGTDGCGISDAEADSARDLARFSSSGPTDDGRIKPDLVAPGTHITGARTSSAHARPGALCDLSWLGAGGLYALSSGTSQAAPAVAGAAAVFYDWYETRPPDSPLEASGPPSPALIKAALVASAVDLAGGADDGGVIRPGPDARQGFGRPELQPLLDGRAAFVDQEAARLDAQGDVQVDRFEALGGPVRIALAWTDPPGPITGRALVNDLDLEVYVDGAPYLGNSLREGLSRRPGAPDRANNVEVVQTTPLPEGARIDVVTRATRLQSDGAPGRGTATDQDFAIAAVGADWRGRGAAGDRRLRLAGQLEVTDADADGVAEAGEELEVRAALRNLGGEAAEVPDDLEASSGGLATVEPASRPLGAPTVAAGQETRMADAFRVTPGAEAACRTVPVRVQLPGHPEASASFPIEVTGPVSPLPAVEKAEAPALPVGPNTDVSAVSSLTVPAASTVQRVRVDVLELRHGFIGDLRLTLTGPDGTAVVLADGPGGVDNPSNDLIDTVFADDGSDDFLTVPSPHTGRFRPLERLEAFRGKPTAGEWRLRVDDLGDGDGGSLLRWSIQIDATECAANQVPELRLDAPAAARPAAVIDVTAHPHDADLPRDDLTVQWDLDGDDAFDDAAGDGARVTVGTDEAEQVVRAKVRDAAGATAIASRRVVIDGVAPESQIVGGPAPLTNAAAGTLVVKSEEGADVLCSIDTVGDPTEACPDPFDWGALGEGEHTLRYRAVDAAGNVEMTRLLTFRIDRTAPSLVLEPLPGSSVRGTSVQVLFSSEPGAETSCAIGGASPTSCSSPFVVPVPDNGDLEVTVRATDAAGNATTRSTRSSVVSGSGATDSTPTPSGDAGTKTTPDQATQPAAPAPAPLAPGLLAPPAPGASPPATSKSPVQKRARLDATRLRWTKRRLTLAVSCTGGTCRGRVVITWARHRHSFGFVSLRAGQRRLLRTRINAREARSLRRHAARVYLNGKPVATLE